MGGSAWAEVQKPQFARNVQGTEKFVGAEPEVGGQNGTEERGAEEALSLQVGHDRRGVSRALHPGNPTSV